MLKSEHLAPTRAHSCEQVWEGGRNQSTLSQNGYGVPKFFKRISEKYSLNLSFEKYSEKYCRISNVQQKPIIFSEDHEFRNNSEFSGHRSSCSEISLRKTLPHQASYLLRIFLREISRAPFRGNKWLSSLELAARRAKLIGKTHVRTPQVRRFLSKRELVRKGSEKTA